MGMRCIFCKKDSSNSRSVEHIPPESLSNEEHTLPAGIVWIPGRLLDFPYQDLPCRCHSLRLRCRVGPLPDDASLQFVTPAERVLRGWWGFLSARQLSHELDSVIAPVEP